MIYGDLFSPSAYNGYLVSFSSEWVSSSPTWPVSPLCMHGEGSGLRHVHQSTVGCDTCFMECCCWATQENQDKGLDRALLPDKLPEGTVLLTLLRERREFSRHFLFPHEFFCMLGCLPLCLCNSDSVLNDTLTDCKTRCWHLLVFYIFKTMSFM